MSIELHRKRTEWIQGTLNLMMDLQTDVSTWDSSSFHTSDDLGSGMREWQILVLGLTQYTGSVGYNFEFADEKMTV